MVTCPKITIHQAKEVKSVIRKGERRQASRHQAGTRQASSFDFNMNVCRKVMTSILRGARRSRLPALTELACPRLPFCQLYLLFHSYAAGPQYPFTRVSPRTNEKTERNRGLFTWVLARANEDWLGKNDNLSLESASPLASSPSKEIVLRNQ